MAYRAKGERVAAANDQESLATAASLCLRICVPPYVPHQEINASADEALECVVVRSGQEPIIVNLQIASVEPPEEVRWIDPVHPGD